MFSLHLWYWQPPSIEQELCVCVCKTCYVCAIIKVYHLEMLLHWIRSVTSQAPCAERIGQDSSLLLCCIRSMHATLSLKKKKKVLQTVNLSTEKAVHGELSNSETAIWTICYFGTVPIQKWQYEQYVTLSLYQFRNVNRNNLLFCNCVNSETAIWTVCYSVTVSETKNLEYASHVQSGWLVAWWKGAGVNARFICINH